ncbi:MAG: cytochrome CBB3 [Porticoccaceae bacterium]|nr:MAG: cytochrome CBB3 [Porticoccaceae bacterium]
MLAAALPLTAEAAEEEKAVTLDGADLYQRHCSTCHDGAAPKAPALVKLQLMSARSVLAALETGAMKQQARHLSRAEKVAVAEHVSGSRLEEELHQALPAEQYCTRSVEETFSRKRNRILDWGFGLENRRYIPAEEARLDRSQLPALKLKWVFAFPGATRVRSQPTVYDGIVFVGSQDGTVYALDLEEGCVYWTFVADQEVRTAIQVKPASGDGGATLFFADFSANVYALDAASGGLLWKTRIDYHPDVTVTGSPRIYGDSLYVPLSSSEWASAADPSYPCCTFRGGVARLALADGRLRWLGQVVVSLPAPTGRKNAAGTPFLAPSGGPVWNSPTVDVTGARLFVGTGESYSSPAHEASDAVVSFALPYGERRVVYQALRDDAWNLSCNLPDKRNCPEEFGPDFDIGAPVILQRAEDDLWLYVGQKSGDVYKLRLDADGGVRLAWRKKVGRGGFLGGVHWGMALAEGKGLLLVPIADTDVIGRFSGARKPGLYALDLDQGGLRWAWRAPLSCPSGKRAGCDPGLSAPVTVAGDLVFAAALDGTLRIHDLETGKLLWQYDTDRDYPQVTYTRARGGSIESIGAVVTGGNVLVGSGYLWGGRMAGNALLNFSIH